MNNMNEEEIKSKMMNMSILDMVNLRQLDHNFDYYKSQLDNTIEKIEKILSKYGIDEKYLKEDIPETKEWKTIHVGDFK